MKETVIESVNLTKEYTSAGTGVVRVFHDVSFALSRGEIAALTGASGSGKSTLLNILGSLDKATSGKVLLENEALNDLSAEKLSQKRNKKIGFIFQFHHLLPEFTALENVMMPALIAGTSDKASARRAEELLDEVGLSERAKHKPSELSGGEAQRVAVARAFMMQPSLILADEPTGNLDEVNSTKLFDMMLSLAQKHEQTFLIATHNLELAKRASRHMHLEKGILTEVGT
jgi:lipoprotein-releasing system ATP-binding protein